MSMRLEKRKDEKESLITFYYPQCSYCAAIIITNSSYCNKLITGYPSAKYIFSYIFLSRRYCKVLYEVLIIFKTGQKKKYKYMTAVAPSTLAPSSMRPNLERASLCPF